LLKFRRGFSIDADRTVANDFLDLTNSRYDWGTNPPFSTITDELGA